MDSSKMKSLAYGARDALRGEVSARLDAVLAEGSAERAESRDEVTRIERAVHERGRDMVVEENAYTWFNRLCALRYMDARGYTPVGVVTPREGATQPAVLADAAQGSFDPELEISGEARARVSGLLSGAIPSHNATEEAYAELLTAACERYAEPMPYLFDKAQASALLMPQGLLSESSILRRISSEMDDESCAEGVEILGWLYQFYIAERKDEVFAGFKKNKKAGAEEIGPATQLFTPNWIVRYLAENSLGRLWMLNNPGSELAEFMDYYIAPEEPEEAVEVSSADEIKVLDPACGSGHILVYAFDLLFKMYEEEGWLPEDIPAMILQNNLFGFEIDPRAAEIASFALEMKARERDPRFFERGVDAKVVVLRPVRFDECELEGAGMLLAQKDLLDAFAHLDEVGSLYVPEPSDILHVDAAIAGVERNAGMFAEAALEKLRLMRSQLEALSTCSHCVIANPPYLPVGNLGNWANAWVKKNYADEKNDLCTCFIARGLRFTQQRSYVSMITMQAWMSLGRYSKMRDSILKNREIVSLLHLGAHAFDAIGGEVVSTAAAVFSSNRSNGQGLFFKLDDLPSQATKESAFLDALAKKDSSRRFYVNQSFLLKIPETPITAYCATETVAKALMEYPPLSDFCTTFRGLQPGDDSFVRYWFEPDLSAVGSSKAEAGISRWHLMTSGGLTRKWYGNVEKVVWWKDSGSDIKKEPSSIVPNEDFYFDLVLGWSRISKKDPSVRLYPEGLIPGDATGSVHFQREDDRIWLVLALMNSSVIGYVWPILNPNMTNSTGIMARIPIAFPSNKTSKLACESLAKDCVMIARSDWDSNETSWDFKWHPLTPSPAEQRKQSADGMSSESKQAPVSLLSERFNRRKAEANARFDVLRANEEELNRIFAEIYGMEGEVPIEVEDKYVSVARVFDSADEIPESFKGNKYVRTKRDEVVSLISYAIGCMLGRWSLDEPGLVLADQGATVDDYLAKVPNPTFMPDEDNVLPILDGEWFEDDVVSGIRRWLAAAYGEETLEENVAFVEGALGKDLRTYLVKDFYADHVKAYQKRPIYWLFQSPKKSFQCLVYMHRYDAGTVGDVLTKYLRPYQEKLTSKVEALERSDSARDAKEANKLKGVLDELAKWEREVIYPLAHERVEIDLDDGVKVNYNKFPRALAKVTGLSEWK